MPARELYFSGVVYGATALLTFGYLLRHGRAGRRSRMRQVIAAMGWPVYWLTFHSPGALFSTTIEGLLSSEAVKLFYWLIALMFIPFYAYDIPQKCTEATCSLEMFGKAILWAPFWPAYIVASLLKG